MRAPRIPAKDVREGDLILTCYHRRTWKVVEKVQHHRPIYERGPSIMLDTPGSRTWYQPDEPVACKRPEVNH